MRILLFIKHLHLTYIICFFLALNIILRSVFLIAEPISHDEPFTIYFSQFDVAHIVKYLGNYNNPPLYEVLLHYWLKLFGFSLYSFRALPMILSSLCVVYLIKTGETFFSRGVALLSASLFTLSTMAMWYAHDCRTYSLFMLLTLMSFYNFFLLIKTKETRFVKFGHFIISSVLLLYSHYFGIIVLGLELLCFAIYYYQCKQQLLQFTSSLFICIIAFVPQLITAITRATHSVTKGTWIDPPDGIESMYNVLWSFSNEPVVTVLCIGLLLTGLLFYLFKYKLKIQNHFAFYVTLWFLLPLIGLFFISYKIPVFLDRYLIFILPAYYLLIALCVQHLFKNLKLKLTASLILMITFLFSFSLNPVKKRNIPQLMQYVNYKKNPETAVVVCPFDFMLTYAFYTDKNLYKVKDQSSEYGELSATLKQQHVYFVNAISSDLSNELLNYKNIIYIDAAADFSMPENHIKETLSVNFKLKKTTAFPTIFKVFEY